MDTSAITGQDILQQLERVLSSATFAGAERSSALLRYLVERAADGQVDRLKEYTVGVEALGKPVGFDPRTDPIVRAEASRLRTRLERYYLAEGAADLLVIELPKGAYLPQIRSRTTVRPEAPPAELPVAPPSPQRSRLRAGAWVLIGTLGTLGAFAAGGWLAKANSSFTGEPSVRFDVQLQKTGVLGSEVGTDVVIAPDGSRLVFVATDSSGVARLRTLRLDGSSASDLPGTEGARGPFFSPDGRWVGFWAAGQIRKIAIDGGSPVALADATDLLGATWGDDGTIVAALNATPTLWRFPAAGGTPTEVLNFAEGSSAPRWPQLLPDGAHVLYTALKATGADQSNIEVARLADGKRTVLIKGGTYGRYLAPGYLTYVNQGTLFAVPFDLDRLEAKGVGTPVLDNVAYSGTFGYAQMDVSTSGTVAYRRAAGRGELVLAWLDSTGHATPVIRTPGRYLWPSLSPDGNRLAVSVVESGVPSVSIYGNVAKGELSLVRKLPGYGASAWSPDSRHLVVGGGAGLARVDVEAGLLRTIGDSLAIRVPWSFTPDGSRFAIGEMSATTAFDLSIVGIDDADTNSRAGRSQIMLQTASYEVYPAISPDGRWLAYSSNESGVWEVYVRAFPDDGTKVKVSRGGGRIPRWSPDGRALFYATDDQRLMVATNATIGGRYESGVPRLWMSARLADTGVLPNFDVSRNGRRILALIPADNGADAQSENHVTLIMHFADELQRRTARPSSARTSTTR